MRTITSEYQVVRVDAIGGEHPESGGHFPFLTVRPGWDVPEDEPIARERAIDYARTCSEANRPASYSVRRVDITEVWSTP